MHQPLSLPQNTCTHSRRMLTVWGKESYKHIYRALYRHKKHNINEFLCSRSDGNGEEQESGWQGPTDSLFSCVAEVLEKKRQYLPMFKGKPEWEDVLTCNHRTNPWNWLLSCVSDLCYLSSNYRFISCCIVKYHL